MNKNEKIPLGWRVPNKIRDDFAQWCSDNGLVCQHDCAGALVIWPYLPSSVREAAKAEAKGQPSVDKKFWEIFGAGLEAALSGQPATPPHRRGK